MIMHSLGISYRNKVCDFLYEIVWCMLKTDRNVIGPMDNFICGC